MYRTLMFGFVDMLDASMATITGWVVGACMQQHNIPRTGLSEIIDEALEM